MMWRVGVSWKAGVRTGFRTGVRLKAEQVEGRHYAEVRGSLGNLLILVAVGD